MTEGELVLDFIRQFMPRWPDSVTEQIRERLHGGVLVVRYGRFPRDLATHDSRLEYTPSSIDWNIQYEPQTNSCQLWLHSLETVRTLVQAYEHLGEVRDLDLAYEIAASWIDYADGAPESRFTWYDHSTSDRSINLIYLHATMRRLAGRDREVASLEKALAMHGAFLADPRNYSGHQNHGTMMNRALYLLAQYLDHPSADAWRDLAVRRLRENFKHSYSPRMVNLENSSSYHLFNFELFTTLEWGLLHRFGDSLHPKFRARVDAMLDFIIQLVRPDGTLPVIGDGNAKVNISRLKQMPSYRYFKDHPGLEHILTAGNEGLSPSGCVASYPDEGYAMLRSSWGEGHDGGGAPTHVVFTAGYLIDNHRHADDLSFTMHAQGRDVVVDPGTFTYQPGDARQYFKSALAHNTVIVDGKPFRRLGPHGGVGISAAGSGEGYVYVQGKNCRYPGVAIRRSVVTLRSGGLLIVDDIVGDRQHRLSQLMHLAHQLEPEVDLEVGEGRRRFRDAEGYVEVTTFVGGEIRDHRGVADVPGFGLVSEEFGIAHETTTLEIVERGAEVLFVTLVSSAIRVSSLGSVRLVGDSFVIEENDSSTEVPLSLLALTSERVQRQFE